MNGSIGKWPLYLQQKDRQTCLNDFKFKECTDLLGIKPSTSIWEHNKPLWLTCKKSRQSNWRRSRIYMQREEQVVALIYLRFQNTQSFRNTTTNHAIQTKPIYNISNQFWKYKHTFQHVTKSRRKLCGNNISILLISVEKRLKILPFGVTSKKFIGKWRALFKSSLCKKTAPFNVP